MKNQAQLNQLNEKTPAMDHEAGRLKYDRHSICGGRTSVVSDELKEEREKTRVVAVAEVEPWPEAVDGGALLDGLRQEASRFVVLPAWGKEALALFTLHTYAYELRDVSTYLGIESPQKQCGKTTLLTVLSELVNRPVVSSNVSPPALFRVIEELRPTLLIDEADTFLKGNDEFRGILNSGYSRKTAFVLRVANEKVQSPKSDG